MDSIEIRVLITKFLNNVTKKTIYESNSSFFQIRKIYPIQIITYISKENYLPIPNHSLYGSLNSNYEYDCITMFHRDKRELIIKSRFTKILICNSIPKSLPKQITTLVLNNVMNDINLSHLKYIKKLVIFSKINQHIFKIEALPPNIKYFKHFDNLNFRETFIPYVKLLKFHTNTKCYFLKSPRIFVPYFPNDLKYLNFEYNFYCEPEFDEGLISLELNSNLVMDKFTFPKSLKYLKISSIEPNVRLELPENLYSLIFDESICYEEELVLPDNLKILLLPRELGVTITNLPNLRVLRESYQIEESCKLKVLDCLEYYIGHSIPQKSVNKMRINDYSLGNLIGYINLKQNYCSDFVLYKNNLIFCNMLLKVDMIFPSTIKKLVISVSNNVQIGLPRYLNNLIIDSDTYSITFTSLPIRLRKCKCSRKILEKLSTVPIEYCYTYNSNKSNNTLDLDDF